MKIHVIDHERTTIDTIKESVLFALYFILFFIVLILRFTIGIIYVPSEGLFSPILFSEKPILAGFSRFCYCTLTVYLFITTPRLLGIPLYFISLIPLILIGVLLAIYCSHNDRSAEKQRSSHYEYTGKRNKRSSSGTSSTNIFAGLSMADAKKKYRELLKQYHPDNVSAGDEDVAKQIIEDYQRYQKAHG